MHLLRNTSSSSIIPIKIAIAALMAAVAGILTGCSAGDAASPPVAAPSLEVKYFTVKTENVTLPKELPGRASAYRVAEVRARINGIVLERLFEEGTDVTEGQVLFVIDPAPYQAALDSAKASLARAEASLVSISAQTKRFRGLVATNAISQQNYDDALARELVAKAEVSAAQAAVRAAEINLDYTRVAAPISGRIGRASVTEGAYVQQATATLLATIQQLDPLYIDLNQSAEEVLRLKAALSSGRLQRTEKGEAELNVILESGRVYEYTGSLQFSDVSVNPSTGTVALRGTVPNPDNDLLPGMFVRARIEEGTDPNAILVPQPLVSRNAKGEAVVMLVNEENKVEARVVETARTVGDRWLVTKGLEPGDRIIMDNLHKVRPGIPVTPIVAQAKAEETGPKA